ncbi:hypothetical protein [Halorubrum miltondacostae]|uniref:hypothetical protein n=1 Tax=Halorubrum miltondacostae TaxID=3076378 RepID=UPI00352760F9
MVSESEFYQLPDDCIVYPGSLDPREGVYDQWFCVMRETGDFEIRTGKSTPRLKPNPLDDHIRPDDISAHVRQEVIYHSDPVDFAAVADDCHLSEDSCVPRVWGGLPVEIAELHFETPHAAASVSTRLTESMREDLGRGRAAPHFDDMEIMQSYLPE